MTSVSEKRRKRKVAFNIRQAQAAGRPRKDGERYSCGDLKHDVVEMNAIADALSVSTQKAERDGTANPWVSFESIRSSKAPLKKKVRTLFETQVEDIRRVAGNDLLLKWELGARRIPGNTCVYIVNAFGTNLFKIGYATNLKRRLNQLSSANHQELNAIAWVSMESEDLLPEVEAVAHHYAEFWGEKVKGEWFKLHPWNIWHVVTAIMYFYRDRIVGLAFDEHYQNAVPPDGFYPKYEFDAA